MLNLKIGEIYLSFHEKFVFEVRNKRRFINSILTLFQRNFLSSLDAQAQLAATT